MSSSKWRPFGLNVLNWQNKAVWERSHLLKLAKGYDLLYFARCVKPYMCVFPTKSWWRHQMETFSALLAICVGNSLVIGRFLVQRPVTWGYDVLIDLRLNKRLSKQCWGWWFETPSRSLWRHCNDVVLVISSPVGNSYNSLTHIL